MGKTVAKASLGRETSEVVNHKTDKGYVLRDFPGINDAADSDGKYFSMLEEGIKTCDLLLYLTTAESPFVLQSELTCFNKIVKIVKEQYNDLGVYKEIFVVVNKYDSPDDEEYENVYSQVAEKTTKNIFRYSSHTVLVDKFIAECSLVSKNYPDIKKIIRNAYVNVPTAKGMYQFSSAKFLSKIELSGNTYGDWDGLWKTIEDMSNRRYDMQIEQILWTIEKQGKDVKQEVFDKLWAMDLPSNYYGRLLDAMMRVNTDNYIEKYTVPTMHKIQELIEIFMVKYFRDENVDFALKWFWLWWWCSPERFATYEKYKYILKNKLAYSREIRQKNIRYDEIIGGEEYSGELAFPNVKISDHPRIGMFMPDEEHENLSLLVALTAMTTTQIKELQAALSLYGKNIGDYLQRDEKWCLAMLLASPDDGNPIEHRLFTSEFTRSKFPLMDFLAQDGEKK